MSEHGGHGVSIIRYETTVELVRAGRASTDNFRLLAGLRIAQMDKRYGSQLMVNLAKDANIGRATLYEYARVACFLVEWLQFSARGIFRDFPFLTYSHIREAIANLDDFEERIEALMAVADGDREYPEYSTSLPMTVDQFRAYLGALTGKHSGFAPPAVLWRGRGTGFQVFQDLQRERSRWGARRVEIIVRELKR